jgi:small membrane protein
MLFQIGVICFAMLVILRTYGQYKKEVVSRYWLGVFSLLWALVAVAALVPRATDTVAQWAGVGRGVDMLVYAAVLVLLYVVYRLLVRTQRMHEEITELVRQIALSNPKAPVKKEGDELVVDGGE